MIRCLVIIISNLFRHQIKRQDWEEDTLVLHILRSRGRAGREDTLVLHILRSIGGAGREDTLVLHIKNAPIAIADWSCRE